MGLDGGTIITRSDVLRGQCWDLNKADDSRSSRGGSVQGTFKRPKLGKKEKRGGRGGGGRCELGAWLKLWPRRRRRTAWSTCRITEQPLAAPVVLDFLGQGFYNRQAVVEWLLAKKGVLEDEAALYAHLNRLRQAGAQLDHITCLADVFEVHLPGLASAAAGPSRPVQACEGGGDEQPAAPHHCPLTDAACDAGAPFVALASCGHVLAERALREVGGTACGVCGKEFCPDDVVHVLGSEAQVEALRALLPARRRRGGGTKKAGKKRRAQPD